MLRLSFWLLLLACLVILTPFSQSIDLAVSHWFYYPQENKFTDNAFFHFIYQYGEWPGLAVGICALGVWIASYYFTNLKKWRPGAQVLVLTLIIGAGIITNGLLKNYWERPRPKQTIEFGGDYAYRPYYQPYISPPIHLKSFPSGHAMMGFYFLAFIPIGIYYHNKKLIWFGAIAGLTFGLALSITRIAQGGHYLTDALFSGILSWLTILIISTFALKDNANV